MKKGERRMKKPFQLRDILDLRLGICDWAVGCGNPGSSKLFGGLLQYRFRHSPSFGFEATAMLCRPIANRKSKIANP
jgi:hypothetical protein